MKLQTYLARSYSFFRLFSIPLFTTLIMAFPLHAQWSASEDGGVLITERTKRFSILPDGEGGVWVGYNFNHLGQSFTRVQRIDSDGNLLFEDGGVSMAADSVEKEYYFTGLQPGLNGEVVVILNTYHLHPDTIWCMYGQRITLEGERVWEEPQQASDGQYDSFECGSRYVTASDSAGGFWTVYQPFMSLTVFVCGLNYDGTRKLEEDIQLESTSQISICADEAGGVIVAWDATDEIGSKYNQVYPNGNLRYETPINYHDNSPPKKIIPDFEGGFYSFLNSTSPYVWLARTLASGSTPWGRNNIGVYISYGSDLIDMEDGSIVTFGPIGGGGLRSSIWLARISPDGSPYYEQNVIRIDSSATAGFHDYFPPPLMLRDHADGMYGFAGWYDFYGSGLAGLRAYRISNDGDVLWGDAPNPVFVTLGAINHPQNLALKGASVGADSSAIILLGTRDDSNPDYYVDPLTAYKILPSGQIAGRDSMAVNHGERETVQPQGFDLLSVYPNPSNHMVHMQIKVNVPGTYTYSISNVLGHNLTISSQYYPVGIHTVLWLQADSISTGIYFIHWEYNNTHLATKEVFLIK